MDFLHQTHQFITQHFAQQVPKSEIDGLCIILPSRRAAKSLKGRFEGLFKPQVLAIDDFVEHVQEDKIQKADQVTLLLTLQDALIQHLEESDSLLSIVSMLLKDFNALQQSRVDLKAFFAHLSDIKRVQQWGLQLEEVTPTIHNHLEFWSKLDKIFETFDQTLKDQGLAYRGLLYRRLAEHIEDLVEHPDYAFYYFVGFNTLTQCEKDIISALQAAGKAITLWDTDTFYMSNTSHQAGKHLRQLKADRNITPNDWQWEGNLLRSTPKQITFYGNSNATLQAKTLQNILQDWDIQEQKRTCIILPDENLLMPVLYSLDQEMHIAIGNTMNSSILFNLIDALFVMHQTSKRVYPSKNQKDLLPNESPQVESYFYKDIFKIIKHPFVKIFEDLQPNTTRRSFVQDTIKYITQYNIIQMTAYQIRKLPQYLMKLHQSDPHADHQSISQYYQHFEPLLQILFASWHGEAQAALLSFEQLGTLFDQGLEHHNSHLERLHLESFNEILTALRNALSHRQSPIQVNTLKTLLYQLMREERIVFQSKKAQNTHIMGMLETRALDFENVIILSCNEDTFPLSKRINSLIPIDIARQYGIPTYEESDAQVSYNFYRLLQRAQKVALLYVHPSKTYGAKEKSRFLTQIQSFLLPENPQITFEDLDINLANNEQKKSPELVIQKTPEIIDKIIQNFKKGVSCSQLNTYLRCPLTYYFRYVAKIKEPEKIEEEIGSNIFGSLIHKVLEDLYAEIAQNDRKVTIKDLQSFQDQIPDRVLKTFEAQNKGYELIGKNYIGLEMSIKQINDFVNQQIDELQHLDSIYSTDYFEILGLELGEGYREELPEDTIQFDNVPFKTPTITFEHEGQDIDFKLIGIIDRLDIKDNNLRIIDYKTGTVWLKALDILDKEEIKDVFDIDTSHEKIRQLWIYVYMVMKGMDANTLQRFKDKNIIAGIYATQQSREGLITVYQNDRGRDYFFNENPNFLEDTEARLIQIAKEMLDLDVPFERREPLQPFNFKEMF